MATRIQIRRDYANNWKNNNPILTEGEMGYELDTGKLKIGDGVSSWNILTYFQETIDYTAITNAPTVTQISNWDAAHSWGDHSIAGYLSTSSAETKYQPLNQDLSAIGNLPGNNGLLKKLDNGEWEIDTQTYLTTDADAAKITSSLITNWDNAYSWGDHSAAGYLKDFTETDPLFMASAVAKVTSTQVLSWNTAYSWGDHSAIGYAKIVEPPISPTSDGVPGTFAYDNEFVYVCVSDNKWLRLPLQEW